MPSKFTTKDGDVVVTTSDDGQQINVATPSTPVVPMPPHGTVGYASDKAGFNVGVHSDRPLDTASFIAGLMLGALLFFILQTAMRWHARREVKSLKRAAAIGPQPDDGVAAAVAALTRRTATLETIVTDPAQRTAREIEALR